MPSKVYISKITLPVGNESVTFHFEDEYVRQRLAGGLQFNVCYDGGEPVVANIPAGVVVKYNNVTYTGTLAASEAEPLTFYLVKSGTQVGGMDIYDEYTPVGSPKSWEKIGDTQFDFSRLKALAYKDAISLEKGSGHDVLGADTVFSAAASSVVLKSGESHSFDQVLGASTTFSASSSNVSVSGSETSKILGANTTFKAAASDVVFADDPTSDEALGVNATFTTSVASSNKYLAASASGMDIASDTNDIDALTAIGTCPSDTFYKSASGEVKKLETESIYGTDGSESVSHVSNIDTKYLSVASVPHVSSVGSADTWAFTHNSSTNTLVISGGNGSALTLAENSDTVATGAVQAGSEGAGSSIVTGFDIDPVSAAKKAANATRVATGSLLASDAEGYAEEVGAEVVYGLSTSTGSALTSLGTQSKTSVLTGVVVTDPSISLSLEDESAVGRVSVGEQISSANISTTVNAQDAVEAITALASATAEGQAISVDSKEELTAFTSIGTVTAAGQDITIGSNDLVNVVTGLGAMEAEGQVISIATPDTIKVAEYDDLDIEIS